ncbi:hypothetical protein M409DRAFT_61347 [Zasmidium cellare ATCC 36951]|uniref:Sulfotransferase domain-containing protein n=1 Tax=Zasmidium cellare ATCC 36951 TaxID=1080233 RepID=A0A6A6BVK4_ZASCE|nr:uncharacterized protein M409DRAFT_61347 [Zasmidium cellare ATCC 36951]KAF2158844.1 hypothetical protein M409DRAFT_61347 [Zasmidium cellare ATCC 36951]
MSSTTRPSQIIFFSHPRAACHLLERMLSKQPGVQVLWHPYAITRPAQIPLFTEESIAAGIPEESRKPYLEAVEQGNEAWEKALSGAKAKDDTLFMHEHPHFAIDVDRGLDYVTKEWNTEKPTDNYARNFTLFPESVLLAPGTTVLLNIRHPALSGPGAFKGMRTLEHSWSEPGFLMARHLGWQREMYDWYVSKGITPIVVDAEDYMSSQEFVRHLAAKLGLSPEHCVFKWEKVSQEERAKMHPMYVRLQQTLLDSEGMVESKVRRNVNVDEEEKKWRAEWGDDAARLLKETTEASLPHYEYLMERRLRL